MELNLFLAEINVTGDGVAVEDIAPIVEGHVLVAIYYNLQEISTIRPVPRVSYILEYGSRIHAKLIGLYLDRGLYLRYYFSEYEV